MQADFAIITIRHDEFAAVLQRFPSKPHIGPSGRTYGICEVRAKTGNFCKVAIVRCSEQGNDLAQQIANDIIADLNPQMILVVGIAGGVPHDDFTLGDVIISTRIVNLNVSKRLEDGREEFDTKGGIHPKVSDITASLPLYQQALAGWNDPNAVTLPRPKVNLSHFETDKFRAQIANGHKNAAWYREVRTSLTAHFGKNGHRTRPPLFQTGTIASSNSVIRNISLLVQWLKSTRSILAVEMEAAGIYQATQKIHHQYPFMAIRGISDIIGFERDGRWTKYACQTAAAFAYAFVTVGIINPGEHVAASSMPHSSTFSSKNSAAHAIKGRLNSLKDTLICSDYHSAYRDIHSLLNSAQDTISVEDQARLKYFEALVYLEGKRPYSQSPSVMQSVEALMRRAGNLHHIFSYQGILAIFKYDFARAGSKRHKAEGDELMRNARQLLPLKIKDRENISIFSSVLSSLYQDYHRFLDV